MTVCFCWNKSRRVICWCLVFSPVSAWFPTICINCINNLTDLLLWKHFLHLFWVNLSWPRNGWWQPLIQSRWLGKFDFLCLFICHLNCFFAFSFSCEITVNIYGLRINLICRCTLWLYIVSLIENIITIWVITLMVHVTSLICYNVTKSRCLGTIDFLCHFICHMKRSFRLFVFMWNIDSHCQLLWSAY
jgi:hypothetical protein